MESFNQIKIMLDPFPKDWDEISTFLTVFAVKKMAAESIEKLTYGDFPAKTKLV